MVNANTKPADVTTAPVPAMDLMMPVFIPACISSLNLDTNNRLQSDPTASRMITDIAMIIQCSWMPRMCCQISTDKPNDVPRDNNTVLTMTAEAITARVSTSMMMKIKQSEAIPAIRRSQFEPSCMSL